MPSVQHVHVNAEHDAMTNDKAAERRSKLVGKIWLLHTCSALLRCKCVGASCSYPTAANRSSWRTNGFAMLTYNHAPMLELLVQVEIVQHGGVHVQELQRSRRHVDRERRPHAERRREQRQRRRGEAGGAGQRRARFVKWSSGATFWTRVGCSGEL